MTTSLQPPAWFASEVARRIRRDRGTWLWRLIRMVSPRIARVVCPTCGPARAVETRVSLLVMASHRQRICSGGDCAIYRERFGMAWCGRPAPLRLRSWLRVIGRLHPGCGCWLAAKQLIPWSKCLAERG